MPLPWWALGAALGAWSVGVLAGQLMSSLLPWLGTGAAVAACLAIVRPELRLVNGLVVIAFMLGAARGALSPPPSLDAPLDGQTVVISGQVDDDPVDRKTSRRLSVQVEQLATIAGPAPMHELRVEATIYGMTPVNYGDLVVLVGVIQRPPRFEQFDYRAYLAEHGIAAVMPSARLDRVTAHAGDPLHTLLFALRHGVIDAVDRSLPEPQAALLLGVVFGYRTALPTLLQQQMISSGLIHIVVISGQITPKPVQMAVR